MCRHHRSPSPLLDRNRRATRIHANGLDLRQRPSPARTSPRSSTSSSKFPRAAAANSRLTRPPACSSSTATSISSSHYPGDYGFIPQTLAEDGDALDVLVMVNEPDLHRVSHRVPRRRHLPHDRPRRQRLQGPRRAEHRPALRRIPRTCETSPRTSSAKSNTSSAPTSSSKASRSNRSAGPPAQTPSPRSHAAVERFRSSKEPVPAIELQRTKSIQLAW